MTENNLWKIIDKEFISYTGGYAYVITNGDCMFHVWERKEDAQKVCDKLNELVTKCNELKEENINQSALIRMLEDTKGLSIEDIIWNTMDYHTQTEFDDDFVEYRENAKKSG